MLRKWLNYIRHLWLKSIEMYCIKHRSLKFLFQIKKSLRHHKDSEQVIVLHPFHLLIEFINVFIYSDAPVGVRSAWVIPHPVLLNNAVPPMFMSCNTVPTSSTSPTPMFFDHGMFICISIDFLHWIEIYGQLIIVLCSDSIFKKDTKISVTNVRNLRRHCHW